ncbi:MAG: universal stress protein [Hyphomicrobiales bacterium]
MPIKTVLVCLNDVERVDPLMAAALEVSKGSDVHLIGLYVIPAIQIYPAVTMAVTPEVFEAQRDYFRNKSAGVKAKFDALVRQSGVSAEWRTVDSLTPAVADGVVLHGHAADLLVVGQVDADSEAGVELDFVERVVMESGRPVLVVPLDWKRGAIGTNVVVGWNGSREAVRAAFDALPLLQQAETVHLVWVDPQKEVEPSGNLPGAEIATALARHGVKATVEPLPTPGLNPGEALLTRTLDHGADLLVMGAYGHSRMREFVFGGATRFVLKRMSVPTLLSH